MRRTGHRDRDKKSQIALEFIIVYSFVLVIFLVIFALIAAQRASTLSSQQFSSLELITQNIATNIDHALAAGPGYSAMIPIVGSISALPYNLYLSSTGVVLANMTIGKQVISAEAYSSARSISVNSTFSSYTANGISVYTIPVYTGTLRIANSGGTVYIDQVPVGVASLPGSMTLTSSASSTAANFNGASSYITTGYPVTTDNGIWTLEAWIDPANLNQLGIAVENGWDNNVVGNGYGFGISNGGLSAGSQLFGLFSGVTSIATGYTFSRANTWYDVVMVRNQSGITSFYVDGVRAPDTSSATPTTSNDFYIGSDTGIRYFNGSIANVQLYNTALSSNGIRTLYQRGMGSAPIDMQNIVGWWPLSGNTKDYGGQGNTGVPYNVSYAPVSQLRLNVKTHNGANASGSPLSAVASIGNMSKDYAGAYLLTDSKGNSSAFITSNSAYGISNVTINGFNGNLSTVGNLVAWFPLNLGYGNITYSPINNQTATFVNPEWSSILGNATNILAGGFNGANSIVNTTFSVPVAASGITISAWVNNNGKGTYWQNIAEVSGEPYTHETLDIGVTGSSGNAVIRWSNYANTFQNQYGGGTIAPNTWYLVTGVWSGFNNTLSVYVDGKLVATGAGNDTGLTSLREINIGGVYPGMDPFNGSIADVQVYNSSLSPAQIQSLYREGIAGTPMGS
ncbi:LamG domain protein jellyroll fold domain protein, partial [mine drainage metagenome]